MFVDGLVQIWELLGSRAPAHQSDFAVSVAALGSGDANVIRKLDTGHLFVYGRYGTRPEA